MPKCFGACLSVVCLASALLDSPSFAQAPQGIAAVQQPQSPQVRPLPEQSPIHAPFRLTPQEEEYLNQVLVTWQSHTEKIKTFRCEFTRWNYNPAFEDPRYKDMPIMVNLGDLKYAAPDKGTFRVSKVQFLNGETGKYEDVKDDQREHWVCDGKSIWEYDYTSKPKRVIERHIPEEMQGQAIRHSPLPFLFGSDATELKRRYFLRIVTPKQFAAEEIWVDAFPRTRHDATNFQRAILRLNRSNFEPVALRIYDPGDTYASYEFSKISINERFWNIKELFAPPMVPFGWKKVLELPPEATAQRPTR
jgi:TIGR03009 family protein